MGAARWDRLPEVSDLLAGRPAPSFGKQTNHTIRALLTAFAIFVAYPVRMILRPESVVVDSFVTWGLRLCYFIDKPVNC